MQRGTLPKLGVLASEGASRAGEAALSHLQQGSVSCLTHLYATVGKIVAIGKLFFERQLPVGSTLAFFSLIEQRESYGRKVRVVTTA